MKIRNLNHQTLAQLCSTSKSHFKLYKSGKTWVVAGLTTIFFGMGLAGLPQTVHAATTATPVAAASSASSDTSSATSAGSVAASGASSSAASSTASSATSEATSTAAASATSSAVASAANSSAANSSDTGSKADTNNSVAKSSTDATSAAAGASSSSSADKSSQAATNSETTNQSVSNADLTAKNTTDSTATNTAPVLTNELAAGSAKSADVTSNTGTTLTTARTAVAATSTTKPDVPTPTSLNNISIALNGGAKNVANEVTFDKNTGQQEVDVSGSFSAGDTLIVNLGTTGVTNVSATDIADTKAVVNGDTITYTFTSGVSATTTEIYFDLDQTSTALSDGQQYTILPITVQLNGAITATNSLVLDKTYKQTDTPDILTNLLATKYGASTTDGTVNNGTVVRDMQNDLSIYSLSYTDGYSNISNQSAVAQFTADSTVTLTFPTTVKITAATLDDVATTAGYSVQTTSDNVAVFTIPKGSHVSDLTKALGNIHISLQAVTTPTETTSFGGPTAVTDWFINQQELTFTDNSSQQSLKDMVYTAIASNSMTYNTWDETYLPLENNTAWTWILGDISNYVDGNLAEATATLTNSNPDSQLSINGVYRLSDSNLAQAGLSTDLTITFTTASGQQETMAYVSGQAAYLTTLGSATDPVVKVSLKTNQAVTTVPAKTMEIRLGMTSYGTTLTTAKMATTFQLVDTDEKVVASAPSDASQAFDSKALVLLQGGQNNSNTMVQVGDTVNLTTRLVNADRNTTGVSSGVVLSHNHTNADAAVLAAYPMTIVAVAPLHTSFASDSAIVSALMRQKFVTNISGLTITHLADENGQQRIAITGVNYLIYDTLNIPVVVNADTLGGTAISSMNTIYVEPNGHFKLSGNRTEEASASLGSLDADLAAGNMYDLTKGKGTMATTMSATVFQTNNAIQGSADSGAQVSTGTVRVDDDNAIGKTILTNGSNTDITDNQVEVELGAGVALKGPVSITDQAGNTVTGYTVLYKTADGQTTTDPTQAVSFSMTGSPLAVQQSLIVSYPLTINADQLQGALSNKSWSYLTTVKAYTGGTYSTGQQFGSDINTTMTLKAAQNVTDSWYIALDTGTGTPQPTGKAITTTGLVGTSYNAFQVTDLGSLTVGQALPDAPQYILKGMYDPSTGTYLDNNQLITYQEQVAADGSISGYTYYMVLGQRYTTQVTSTDYTVHYTGAGTSTPADKTQTVVWTGSTDAVTAQTTWTPSATSIAVTTPTINGYTADTATAYADALAATTTKPSSDMSVTVTYTPDPLTQPATNTAADPVNHDDATANPQLATSIVVQGASKVYDNDASTDPITFTVLAPSLYSAFVVPDLTAADFDVSGVTSQNVGLYQVTLSASGIAKLQAANPTFTFDASDVQNGLFQITPAAITITAPTVSKTYDGQGYTDPLTASVSNLPTKGVAPVYSLTDVSTQVNAGQYAINVTADPAANSNYTITTQSGSLTIDPTALSVGDVTVGNASKVYDNDARTDPTTYAVTLADGLTAPTAWEASDFDTTGITSQNVGQYQATLSASGIAKLQALNPNVVIDGVTAGSLNITAAPLTITANSANKVYDGTAYTSALTATVSGNVAAGDTIHYSLTDMSADVDAGTYDIDVVLGDNPNYQINTNNSDLTITPALVMISGPTVSKTYDGQGYTGDLTPTMTGIPANGAALNYTLTDVSGDTQVGSYAITVTLGTNPNYNVTTNNGTVTITPAAVPAGSLKVSSNTKVYDNDTSSDPTAYTVALIDGLVAPANWDTTDFTRVAGENVGSYAVTLSAAGLAKLQQANPNYALNVDSVAAGALTITPATISITAASGGKVYDGEAYTGDLTPTISGVPANGDQVAYTVTDVSNDTDAGTYTISVTPTANANYSFTATDGQLTITKAPVTITVPTVHKTYDGTNNATINATVSGVPTNGQPVLYALSDLSQAINAGTYAVAAVTGIVDNANYTIHTESGALIIDPLAVTITGPTVTKTYDGAGYTGALNATVTSATNMTAQPDYSLTDVSGDTAVGTYAINVTPSATTNNANYSITTVAGSLTITPASVVANSVTVGNATKVYDGDSATDPTTYTVSLNNGLTAPTDWTSADFVRSDTAENVGSYAVTLSATGLAKVQAANPNYTVTAADVTAGKFTITPAPITITAPTVTKVYDGQADTATLGATVDGQPAKGVTPVYTLTDVSDAVNVGDYPIAVTADAAANTNYTITTVAGSFTITPASVTTGSVQLGDQIKTYDGDTETDPAVYQVTLTDLTAPTNWTGTDFQRAGSSENVGTYDVTLSASGLAKLQAANPNYTLTAANVQAGQLTITPTNITITAPIVTKTYDGKGYAEALTADVDGQPTKGTDLVYTLTDVSNDTNVGTYNIDVTADQTANANYNVTTKAGSLTITAANVATDSIKVGNSTKTYDGDAATDPTTYDVTLNGLTAPAEWTSDDFVRTDTSENAGNYDVTLSASGLAKLQAVNANYTLTTDAVQVGQLTITLADVTITAPTVTKTYDGTGYTDALTATVAGQPEKGVAPVYTLTDVSNDTNVGTYDIDVTADKAANQNYNIVTKSGTLTITSANVATDSIKVGSNTKVYDGDTATDPATYAVTLNGLTEPTDWTSDDFVRIDSSENAGTYDVTLSASGLAKLQAANPNYTIAAADVQAGQLSITPANITITAPTVTKTYDGKSYTDVLTAIVAGQPEKGVAPVYTLTDVSNDTNVGTYDIDVIANQAINANYNITTKAGSLTITPANVATDSIKVGNNTKVYDGDTTTDPTSYDVTLNGLTAPANWTSTDFVRSDTSENIGNYDVTLSASGLAKLQAANPNETITAADVQAGQLSITPANITITAPTVTKVYDGKGYTTALTATVSGQPEKGVAPVYTLTDISGDTNVGTYNIDVTADQTANQNYNITTKAGSLTIMPANVATDSIKVGNSTKAYDGDGNTDPTTYDVTLDNGLAAPTDWTSTDFVRSDDSENVGTYNVTLSASGLAKLQAANQNYTITATDVQTGQLTITPANITITAPTITKVYDGKGYTTALTATVAGQPEKGVAPVYTLTDVSGDTNVGTYNIDVTADQTANQNYNITTKAGSLTVTPQTIGYTLSNGQVTYDGVHTAASATDLTAVLANGQHITLQASDITVAHDSTALGKYQYQLSDAGRARIQALLGTNDALTGVAMGQIEIVAPDTDNNGGTTTPGGTDNGGQPGDNNGGTTTPGGTDNSGQPSDNNGGTTTPGGTDNGGHSSDDNGGTATPSGTDNSGQSGNSAGSITTTNNSQTSNAAQTGTTGTSVGTVITPTTAAKPNAQSTKQAATTLPQTGSQANTNLMLLGLLLISLTGFVSRFGKRKVD